MQPTVDRFPGKLPGICQARMVACARRFCYDKAAETYSTGKRPSPFFTAKFVLRRTFLKENKPNYKLTKSNTGGQIHDISG